ncbi:gamma-glutamyltransferase [Marinobacter salicampi]|uniref:gamma-glutamyltransferase n=1 Tax=Marinobacter salicampi TaxID=435907 RepID=UPI001F5EEECC|nr:gamma-glutamyltransferase [Marinobacter salicampi]
MDRTNSGIKTRAVFLTGLVGLVALLWPGLVTSDQTENIGEPDPARMMVASGNRVASEVGVRVIERGGNAVDAAVAVQMMLAFVAGPSTGIGGGGFMVYRDGQDGNITVYDGRETAPGAIDPSLLLVLPGVPMPLWFAVISGYGAGVPGTVAMLHLAHSEQGRLHWADLIQPAIAAARKGVDVPERLQLQVAKDPSLGLFDGLEAVFVTPVENGDRLTNKALADTLERIAEEGPSAFYEGAIPEAIVAGVRNESLLGSGLTTEDFDSYEAKRREPVCGDYREWTICGPPPPSGGGLAVLQLLGILEHFNMGAMEPGSAEAIHVFSEASRLALADVNHYVGDPAFVDVPLEHLLSDDYLAERAALVSPDEVRDEVSSGTPDSELENGVSRILEPRTSYGTSHFSIVDGNGGVVSMTNSNAAPFGSRVVVNGFVVNSQLTDFDFDPRVDGQLVANAPEPHKRPRSSMSPVIVMDPEGEVRLVVGSRGGGRIVHYVAKVLVAVLDWNLSIQQAIDLPNVANQGHELELEEHRVSPALVEQLENLGHDVAVHELMSGLHGFERHGSGWRGGTDARVKGSYVPGAGQ